MNFYKINDKYCFSFKELNFNKISKIEFENAKDEIYFLYRGDVSKTRESLIISDIKELFIEEEKVENLSLNELSIKDEVDNFIKEKIKLSKVIGINLSYNFTWDKKFFSKKKVNLLGLGDVGGNLLIGLRLLGGDVIDEIGIYDLNEDRMKRYEMELNQIVFPNDKKVPKVKILDEKELFDCDVFIFTASKFVPKVGNEKTDVRMVQYQANKKIISIYAKLARKENFEGLFAVVSDPVDLLCNVVYYESNNDKDGKFDNKGLLPNQVRGFGLGVMNGRANYYSDKLEMSYSKEGRVYGPHGKDLIVANSINNYNDEKSKVLTKEVIEANLKVRDAGFKPYIAPALSSGALSILATLRGNFNYSTVFINGIYWGCKNRFINGKVLIERLPICDTLLDRIKESYNTLRDKYEKN